MKRAGRASIEFSLKWQSPVADHTDRQFAPGIDLWRDLFPGRMGQKVSDLQAGERCAESFGPGELFPPFDQRRIVSFRESQFGKKRGNQVVVPRVGRFYPQGLAWTALNAYPQTLTPFRIIAIENDTIVADTNHPLARYSVSLETVRIENLRSAEKRGGASNDIAEKVTGGGPGMQAPHPETETDFYAGYPFARGNEADDRIFYQDPRMVHHLDQTAIENVRSIYDSLLAPGTRLLDLMSSWTSHLPDTLVDMDATGLGLNEEELRANSRLSEIAVHDLNRNPALPFMDDQFDAVVCTASIEYLVDPIAVAVEVARVTRPGGIFATTFSDRWFSGKEIRPWPELHPFERLGLVLDFYVKSGTFENLYTASISGWPRPIDDKYISEKATSDPIFAVWGYVKQ